MKETSVLWEESIPGGATWSHVLKRGTALRLTDLHGGANAGAIFYNFECAAERYNMPDTLKAQHIARLTTGAPSPERRVLGREVGERIASALRSLPERQRAVFVLRHYDELALDDIARALDMSLGTVKSSLHRAVHRMRERLEGLR